MSGTQESDCLWQCQLPWGYHLSPEMPTAMGTVPATRAPALRFRGASTKAPTPAHTTPP